MELDEVPIRVTVLYGDVPDGGGAVHRAASVLQPTALGPTLLALFLLGGLLLLLGTLPLGWWCRIDTETGGGNSSVQSLG